MLFNSFQFLIFFPVVTVLYFLMSHRYRWFWLLSVSCYFYMAFIPAYIFVLFLTIIIDYFAAVFIEKTEGRTRKAFLIASILSTCLVLFIFKYFNFFNANLAALARFVHWNYSIEGLSMILPIGLSFHTFQSLSYVIEVYRGRQKAEHHFGIYALYVMFFPQLVAGPIERPQNLLHQFREQHTPDYERITSGLRLMMWGFFKKIIIADRLAVFVGEVYGHPENFHGRIILWVTYCFAVQIYCDFSGYTDIARGAARVMGFELMKNFKSPYFAESVAEFWRRWHISLSTWFKDYVYIPLGGSHVSRWRWSLNLMIVFLISGLWHGANWTFIIWGALHGFYLLCSIMTEELRKKIAGFFGLNAYPNVRKALRIFITFHLVCFAWIFFRADSMEHAFTIIRNMFGQGAPGSVDYVDGFNFKEKIFIILCVLGLEFVQHNKDYLRKVFAQSPMPLRWAAYYGFILFLIFFGTYKTQQFIYFQF